ncbi:unnamed protein product [Amoebophrya sp. A25]|nr:unnamed protein product [Amoebophrya sp. A25]|eukprot:GSA25T00007060001.1
MDQVAAQRATICNANSTCLADIRAAIAANSGNALAGLIGSKLGTTSDTMFNDDYCGSCTWKSAIPPNDGFDKTFRAGSSHWGMSGLTQNLGMGTCCQSNLEVHTVAYFGMGLYDTPGQHPNITLACRAKNGCVDMNNNATTVVTGPAPYYKTMAGVASTNLTMPYWAHGVLPPESASNAALAGMCLGGASCVRTAYSGAAGGTLGFGGSFVAACAAFDAVPTTCMMGTFKISSFANKACMATNIIAAAAMAGKTSAERAEVGLTDCWGWGGAASSVAAGAWSSGNPACESDGYTPKATVVADAVTVLCADSTSKNAMVAAVDADAHPLAAAISTYMNSTFACPIPTTIAPTTLTPTTLAPNGTTAAPTTATPTTTVASVTKHETAVAVAVDLPATMSVDQKTTAKTSIQTAVHNKCCAPLVGASPKPFSTLANCKSVAGEGGATTAVAMTWSGVLSGRLRVLAAGSGSGTFTVESATAAAIDGAKDLMVAASNSTLTTSSLASEIVSQLTTDFAGTNFSSFNFTASVSSLTVPTTTVTVTAPPAPAAASSANTLSTIFSAVFALFASMLFMF